MNRNKFKTIARRVILGVGTDEEKTTVDYWRSIQPRAEHIYLETLRDYAQSAVRQLKKLGEIPEAKVLSQSACGLGLTRGVGEEVGFEVYSGEMAIYQLKAIEWFDNSIVFSLEMLEWKEDVAPTPDSLTVFLTRDEVTIDQQSLSGHSITLTLRDPCPGEYYEVKVLSTQLNRVDRFQFQVPT